MLSQSIRTTAWRQIENIERDFTIEELRFGIDVLSNSEKVPDFIILKLVFKLFEINELEQVYDAVNGLIIRNNEQLKIVLKKLEKDIATIIEQSLDNLDEEGLLVVAKDPSCNNEIRIKAATKVLESDSIRYMSDILDIFTDVADIENLAKVLVENKSLAKVYPERVLMIWHMISAENAKNIADELEILRDDALKPITDSPEDLILSEVSKALISLLDGIPRDMNIINQKLIRMVYWR